MLSVIRRSVMSRRGPVGKKFEGVRKAQKSRRIISGPRPIISGPTSSLKQLVRRPFFVQPFEGFVCFFDSYFPTDTERRRCCAGCGSSSSSYQKVNGYTLGRFCGCLRKDSDVVARFQGAPPCPWVVTTRKPVEIDARTNMLSLGPLGDQGAGGLVEMVLCLDSAGDASRGKTRTVRLGVRKTRKACKVVGADGQTREEVEAEEFLAEMDYACSLDDLLAKPRDAFQEVREEAAVLKMVRNCDAKGKRAPKVLQLETPVEDSTEILNGALRQTMRWQTTSELCLPLDKFIESLPESEKGDAVREVCRQISDSLAWMHGKGYIHRDVKVDNIVVRPRLEHSSNFGMAARCKEKWTFDALLIDFGMAARCKAGDVVEEPGEDFGTPLYTPPEAHRDVPAGVPTWSAPADVYALGVVISLLFTGKLPYAAAFSKAYGSRTYGQETHDSAVLKQYEQVSGGRRHLKPNTGLWTDAKLQKALAAATRMLPAKRITAKQLAHMLR